MSIVRIVVNSIMCIRIIYNIVVNTVTIYLFVSVIDICIPQSMILFYYSAPTCFGIVAAFGELTPKFLPLEPELFF